MVRWLHGQDLREYPFLAVLFVILCAIGFAMAAPQHWLRAVGVLAFGMGLAGLLRFLFSDTQAGLLRVRSKTFDVTFYFLFAFLTGFFGVVSPGR